MYTELYSFLEKHIELNEADKREIERLCEPKCFTSGELLMQEGVICNAFYFVVSGFARLYYLRKEEEKTAFFYGPSQFISAYTSYIHNKPIEFNVVATEGLEVIEITKEAAFSLLAFSQKFDVVARAALESELEQYQNMIGSLIALSPEERYTQLMNEHPDLFLKVAQKHIASYLGLVPESLSRIKRRVLKKS
jgi:CRP-like cAMP-binding protein